MKKLDFSRIEIIENMESSLDELRRERSLLEAQIMEFAEEIEKVRKNMNQQQLELAKFSGSPNNNNNNNNNNIK